MGKLFVVATPIGNLGDITLRAIEVLKNVDLILCEDTRHSLKLLNHYNIKNKLSSYHKFNEKEKVAFFLHELKTKDLALITDAGTPCISDPGYILVKAVRENNIEVVPLGGISAVTTALSVCGLNTNNFTFYGFFPRVNRDKNNLIESIKNSNVSLYIFYESPKRIIKTLEFLLQNLGNINISLFSDLTKLHEKNYYGEISKVINELKEFSKSNLGEYTLVFESRKISKKEINLSIEAMLIDLVIKNKISLKEAIEVLNKENKEISKKDIYNASLNLKNYLKKGD